MCAVPFQAPHRFIKLIALRKATRLTPYRSISTGGKWVPELELGAPGTTGNSLSPSPMARGHSRGRKINTDAMWRVPSHTEL